MREYSKTLNSVDLMQDAKPSPPLLTVQHLSVDLPENMERRHAVEDLSFNLDEGEILCIVGESGSGKSITASTIMGLLPSIIKVSAGEITFKGTDLLRMTINQRRQLLGQSISMIFQDPLSSLNPLMTIGKQIRETLVCHQFGTRQQCDAKILDLLAEVGLPEPEIIQHQYPFRLSGGQRQRVMIAIALALDPDILIADEPTTALDVTTQAQILDLIRKIQKRKEMGVMFITHDFGVVSEIADRVLVMEKGRLIEQGCVDEVLLNPQKDYTKSLIAAVPHMRERKSETKNATQIILKSENLCKTYHSSTTLFGRKQTVHALKNVSFTLRHAQTLGIVGESGSGKSTLGRALMKLLAIDAGAIFFDNKNITTLGEKEFRPLRSRIQMIFQDPFASLNPRHTIAYSLTAGPLAHGQNYHIAMNRAGQILELVGLDEQALTRFPHEFSGGQKQRIGIARALMLEPEILIADEAVSALDVSVQAQILKLLQDIQHQRNLTIIFITHDLRVASQICDDILVMYRGSIVEKGTPEQIFGNPKNSYTRRLVSAIPRLRTKVQ